MSKKTEPLRKRRTQLSATPTPPTTRSEPDDVQSKRRTFQTALDMVAIVLAVISLVAWIPSFLPSIHIDHRGSIDPARPFFTPFAVTNQGLSAVHEVSWICQMNAVEFANGLNVT